MGALRLLFWELGLSKNCPYCLGRMTAHGFDSDEKQQTWTCENSGCRWSEEGKKTIMAGGVPR